MKRLVILLGVAVVLALGGFLVAASGIIPIKASSGHWAITAWLLNFSMSRSVSTHSLGISVPQLREDHLILKGAVHYHLNCRPCHGAPDSPPPPTAASMTPHPPHLNPVLAQWKPQELFYIVKHGVKFTGMPAWPTQKRDDEVWAMVAFLQQLPKLNSDEYQRLVSGPAEAQDSPAAMDALAGPEELPEAVLNNCARCHGVDGAGRQTGAFPRLAGQNRAYLEASLLAFARRQRHSGVMQTIAAGLEADEMRALADYYGGLPRSTAQELTGEGQSAAVERGERIAQEGIAEQGVPACVDCHGPGQPPRNPHYPLLAGQYFGYLELQLMLFQKGHRGGSEYAHLMQPVASRLNSQQMRDVALYYAHQPPEDTD